MSDEREHAPIPSLAGAPWLVRLETQSVFAALEAAGHEARAVGGTVRNALLGLAVADLDLATQARPEAVIVAARAAGLSVAETGLDHGTVTIIANHVPHEVTTLRRDVATDGRRATVAFTTDWAEDARRRDFTMNALYCDRNGRVYDPLGGYPDVRARRVRFIGDADQRIAEDYLRVLRFFRFHAVLGDGPLDPAGQAACIRGRVGLDRLSAERVRSELVRLLCGARALESINAMIACGLLSRILRRAPRPGVLAALVAAEAKLQSRPDAMARLSALAVAVEEDAPPLAEHLRLSNAERDALLVIDQRLGQAFAGLDDAGARASLYRLGVLPWRRRLLGAMATASHAADRARLGHLHSLPEHWQIPQLPVKGADVVALGIPPGPLVGQIMSTLEQWWIEADFADPIVVRGKLVALVRAISN